MPAPHWFFRFMYNRESTALQRRHDTPQHRELGEKTVDILTSQVPQPGPIADLGCGPGPHSLLLARHGYQVTGIDSSPQMIQAANNRAASEQVKAEFTLHDLREQLPFEDESLGGALSILLLQHLPNPDSFISEVQRCLQPEGHALFVAPTNDGTPAVHRNVYWRLRAMFYLRVPGAITTYDTTALQALLERHGLTVISCESKNAKVTALAKKQPPNIERPHGDRNGHA